MKPETQLIITAILLLWTIYINLSDQLKQRITGYMIWVTVLGIIYITMGAKGGRYK